MPVGTQVVTHVDVKNNAGDVLFVRGVVGVVVKAPVDNTHAYRVRFMDGTELALHRREFTMRKEYQNPLEPELRLDDFELESEEKQECYWELQKFILLALKANPNILECLYTPLVEFSTPLADELIGLREIFLSKMIYQTYNGYVLSQFKKLEHHLQNHGTIKWKHAMHLIRLLLSGIIALHESYIPVRVEEHREQLLGIRAEKLPWSAVNEWRIHLHQEFDTAFQSTQLPDRPDYEQANAFLVKARRSAVT